MRSTLASRLTAFAVSAGMVLQGLAPLAPAYAASHKNGEVSSTDIATGEGPVGVTAGTPGSESVRAPLSVLRVVSKDTLPEAVQKLESDGAVRLIDGDASSEFTAYDQVLALMGLPEERAFHGLRIAGPAPYRMWAYTVSNGKRTLIDGFRAVDLSQLADGWTYLPVEGEIRGTRLDILLRPIPNAPGTGLREIELWTEAAGGEPLAIAARGLGEDESVAIGTPDGVSRRNLVLVSPLSGEQLRGVTLAYEVKGVSHWSEVPR